MKDSLLTKVKERFDTSVKANTFIKSILETRLHEKDFIITGESQYADEIDITLRALSGQRGNGQIETKRAGLIQKKSKRNYVSANRQTF